MGKAPTITSMCISNRNLHSAVESVAVILLTISVVTIGASLNLFDSIIEKMTSVVISFINILLNISLLFGLKDGNKFFICLWMMSALFNVIGGVVLLGLYNEISTNDLDDFIPLTIVKNVYLVCYVVLYVWSWIHVCNLYKEF